MKIKKKVSGVAVGGALVFMAMVGLFQNCGSGFEVSKNLASTSTSTGTGSVTPVETKVAGVTADDLKACRATAQLKDCMETKSALKGVLTDAMFTACGGDVATTSDFDLSMCLTKAGFAIFNYREPLQFDIETCATKVGTAKVAACLSKNAIKPATVTQEVIETCIGAVGIANVEKCLRKNAHLTKNNFLANSDVTLCSKVTGQGTNGFTILSCLQSREVMSSAFAQNDLDTCLTNAPASIPKCLRTAKKVPRVIMQADINRCVSAVGVTKVAACLDGNGYLYDNLLPATALQAEVDICNTNVGAASIARCLRNRSTLEKPVMQAQISACGLAAGPDKIVACLTANGLLNATSEAANGVAMKPVTQAAVDKCFAAVGLAGIAKCLVQDGFLLPKPTQINFVACHRFGDPTGIAGCLDGSGMLPSGVTQANFTTCLDAAGLTGLETCMRNRGFIP